MGIMKSIADTITKVNDNCINRGAERETADENVSASVNLTQPETKDEWIWVIGFKGTDKDMKCHGYQYELGKQHDMPADEPIVMCERGFHLCPRLADVFRYYGIKNENRFFKVKALVRKSDVDALGSVYGRDCHDFSTYVGVNTKLVAKSIEFSRELTVDEILGGYITEEWTDEDKRDAIKIGPKNVRSIIKIRNLVALGYSERFARMIVYKNKYEIAKAVGSQSDLSMDMKVWLIFNNK